MDKELPVPIKWRNILTKIVEFLRVENYAIEQIQNVEPISSIESERIRGNIRAYGSSLDSLHEETWDTSIYIWTGEYWQVLVDLFTVEDGPSDLVLFCRVFEQDSGPRFKVDSVHVP